MLTRRQYRYYWLTYPVLIAFRGLLPAYGLQSTFRFAPPLEVDGANLKVKFYKAITTKDRHECAENLAMIQQLIGMAMYEHGIRYDESGLPIRVPIKGKEDEESGGVENDENEE